MSDIYPKLKWLMLARVVFTAVLLISIFLVQLRDSGGAIDTYVPALYLIVAFIFLLSLFYAVVAHAIVQKTIFAFTQIAFDTLIVSLIVFLTGGYFSLFSFLYIVVVIYASMILYLRGGLALSLICTIQYALLVMLQYYEILPQFGSYGGAMLHEMSGLQIAYRVMITSIACFAVAVLTGLLTEQTRKSQKELHAMEDHVKRVEKMAYMGEMAAGLAHEIKNPLASLVGSIQLLKEDLPYHSDHERLMAIVLRETDRLSNLVSEFLFFARPPAGKPEKFDLKEAVEEICDLFTKDADHAKRFALEKKLTPELTVVMDPTHLRQVLWNLLLNAAEAVAHDGRVAIETRVTKNNHILICVTDNGCGIPAETLQSIFNPFFTTKPAGTGLGLSIVHRILEAYESRLDVVSGPGEGTTVSFLLTCAAKKC